MFGMLDDYMSLKYLNLSNLNTKLVTNMSNMFTSCNILESLDMSKFDASYEWYVSLY